MWTNDEILYAMFISKANNYKYDQVVKTYEHCPDEYFVNMIACIYADLFDDRAIADEEFEAYVPDAIFAMLGSGMQPKMYSKYNPIYPQKIKFRFVSEDE